MIDMDVERLPVDVDDQNLLGVVVGDRAVSDRIGALKELVRRSSPRAASLVRAIVQDHAAPTDLRIAAAIALGTDTRPDHQRALIGALGTPDVRLLRRVATSLGRIGGPDALPALRSVRRSEDPSATRAVEFAKTLIAYRHSLTSDWLKTPSIGTIKATVGRAQELRPGPLSPDIERRITERLVHELPGIPVSVEGGVCYRCGDNVLALLPHRTPAHAAKGSFVPATLLKQSHSLGYFSVHLYILSHPIGRDRLAVFGIRPDGTMTHTGTATTDGSQFDFRIEALNTPLSPPVTIAGRLHIDAVRMELTQILVDPEKAAGQVRARTPQRAR